ncbi:MAG: hypothetical protein ACOCZ5_01770 [bacterium]
MIRIYNYFYDEDKCEPLPVIKGKTRRSFSGKVHSDYSSKYSEYSITLNNLNKKQHDQMTWLLFSLYPDTGEPLESFKFVDNVGNEFQMTIAVDGFNIKEEEKGYYTWEFTLMGTEVT